MDRDRTLIEFADELEKLLHGELQPEAIRVRWWSRDLPPTVGELMAYVEHFLSDEDIRSKDEWYRRMQESEMTSMIECLRSGRIEEARQITFLGYSTE